jgi:hypothetical protein
MNRIESVCIVIKIQCTFSTLGLSALRGIAAKHGRTMKRINKRERERMALTGHLHSPPTNSKAKRKANIQAVLARSKHIVWASDTPSVIAKAGDKSPYVKAYAPTQGAGNGPVKHKATSAHKRKFAGETPAHFTVERVTGKAGSTRTKIATRFKDRPQEYQGEYERNKRITGPRAAPLGDAETARIKGTLGLRK